MVRPHDEHEYVLGMRACEKAYQLASDPSTEAILKFTKRVADFQSVGR